MASAGAWCVGSRRALSRDSSAFQLRTLVDARIPKKLTMGHEDHVTGSWMWSLPAKPNDATRPRAQRLDPTNNSMAFAPPEKDPYTGLVRADFYERASSWFYWWIPKTERMILTHGMKTKEVCTVSHGRTEWS